MLIEFSLPCVGMFRNDKLILASHKSLSGWLMEKVGTTKGCTGSPGSLGSLGVVAEKFRGQLDRAFGAAHKPLKIPDSQEFHGFWMKHLQKSGVTTTMPTFGGAGRSFGVFSSSG